MFYVDLWRNLLPKSYQMQGAHTLPSPSPFSATFRRMRFGKKWFPSPPKNGPFRGLCLRATVLDRFRVEITTSKKEFFQADASGGHLVLSIRGEPIRKVLIFQDGMGCDAKNVVNRPRWAEVWLSQSWIFWGMANWIRDGSWLSKTEQNLGMPMVSGSKC